VPGENTFELVYPRCVRQRADDLEEVHAMLKAGEIDVAVDELRWLLDGCQPLLEAHKLLGEIAMADNDLELARAHFGMAWSLGTAMLPKGQRTHLPYSRPTNRPLLEAGKGLAWCLKQLDHPQMSAEIVVQLRDLDPADPLKLAEAFPEVKAKEDP
jgi:hypothetical protein